MRLRLLYETVQQTFLSDLLEDLEGSERCYTSGAASALRVGLALKAFQHLPQHNLDGLIL